MPITLNRRTEGGLVVADVALDHAPVNILDMDHCRELTATLNNLREEDQARVVVLRGNGRCFSAGVDIEQHTPEKMPELLPSFHAIFEALLNLRAVTIAAVHGFCLGGAAELAFACDRVIAHPKARIGFPEIKVGCYPPVAVPMMSHRVGHGRAVEMIMSGDEVPPAKLAEWGVIDRLSGDDLDAAIDEELAIYRGKSPAVIGMASALLHDQARNAWGTQIAALEKEYLDVLLPHPDASEGIAAFQEKRQAIWKDAAGSDEAR